MNTPDTNKDTALEGIAMPGFALNIPEQFAAAMAAHQEINAATAAMDHAFILGGSGAAALPDSFKLHDLEAYMPQRRRPRGTYSTQYVPAFAAYTVAHAQDGTTVFVDADRMRATAVLDLGTSSFPGHTDNRAVLELKPTAAYAALCKFAGTRQGQADAAEFFEDWAQHVEMAFYADGEQIELRKAIAAVRRITIDSARKVESEAQQLSASMSAFESVQASSREPLPTTIYFTTKPYADLEPRLFVLRLSVTVGDKAPQLVARIQNAEQHTQQMGEELVLLAASAMRAHPEIAVLQGSYSKGN